jgi:hypothetical protein
MMESSSQAGQTETLKKHSDRFQGSNMEWLLIDFAWGRHPGTTGTSRGIRASQTLKKAPAREASDSVDNKNKKGAGASPLH